jgi:hypothetical protein
MTVVPPRFVAVTATGVLNWITQARRSPERDLVEHLIAHTVDHGVDLRVLARHQGLSMSELGRILFALNRSREILVSLDPPVSTDLGERCLAGLQKDLQDLVGSGQPALLVDHDGLCIAAIGCSVSRASQLAAAGLTGRDAPAVQATLCFANEVVTVLSSTNIDRAHPAWISLARRLLPACGAMSFRRGAWT